MVEATSTKGCRMDTGPAKEVFQQGPDRRPTGFQENELDGAIERLWDWLRDFGHKRSEAFTDDVGTVVEAAKRYRAMVKQDEPDDRCECHERDGSYVCKYCYAKGLRGHMQG